MPDLIGMGIREAVAMCADQGLKLKAAGDGVVSLQNPSPGALVSQDTICRVKLSREATKRSAADMTSKTPPAGGADPPRGKAGRMN
jgi:beta-lactam-binding protein with PASTA domain